jgi:hypothetical protein
MANRKHCNGASTCPECGIEPFSRNHYFTGKLLVERDFRDEQRYLIDKLRHHHQRLHGWGVVCGLQVTAHENPECRDRFLCVEPGSAVDCCGREILVPERLCLEILEQDAVAALEADPDTDHRLQLCLRYRECPAEEIPVLYDECSCDDTRCAPNRIREGYRLELRVAPAPPEPSAPREPHLVWRRNIDVGNPGHMALHGNRLYVASWTTSGDHGQVVLYRFNTETCTEEESYPLGRECLGLAVSTDGALLFLLTRPESREDPWELLAFSAADLASGPESRQIPESGDGGSVKRLVPAADGSLHTLVAREHAVWHLIWPAGATTSPKVIGPCDLPETKLGRTAFNGDLSRLYLSLPLFEGGEVRVLDPTDLTRLATIPLATAWQPRQMIPLRLAGAELLAFCGEREGADGDYRPMLWLMDPQASSPMLGSLELSRSAGRLLASPDGRWIYVLEMEVAPGGDRIGFLEAVSAQALQDCRPGSPASSLQVGVSPTDAVASASGERVYSGFANDRDDLETGGIAVVAVTEGDCTEPLRQADCPECEDDDCLVLATIEDYRHGDSLEDMPEAGGPAPDGQAYIDDESGRRRLPSVQALAGAINCLLEGGVVGPRGPQGPPGEPGRNGTNGSDGLGIDEVTVEMVPCRDEHGNPVPAARSLEGEPGSRTLHLTLPGSCSDTLTHICAISWAHGGIRPPDDPQDESGNRRIELMIRFDGEVEARDLTAGALQLWLSRGFEANYAIWLQARTDLEPVAFGGEGCEIEPEVGEAGRINGVRLIGRVPARYYLSEYRVLVKGHFIRDAQGRALDADHLPGWLPDRPTGNGIEGGTFESWFAVRYPIGRIGNIPVHEIAAMLRTSGTVAERVIAYINDNRILSPNEIEAIEGVPTRILERFRRGFSDR